MATWNVPSRHVWQGLSKITRFSGQDTGLLIQIFNSAHEICGWHMGPCLATKKQKGLSRILYLRRYVTFLIISSSFRWRQLYNQKLKECNWKKVLNSSVHDHPLYLVCPDLLRAVGETSFGIRVGFIGSDEVLTTFLFICVFICI
jgi:hypothetical protein